MHEMLFQLNTWVIWYDGPATKCMNTSYWEDVVYIIASPQSIEIF